MSEMVYIENRPNLKCLEFKVVCPQECKDEVCRFINKQLFGYELNTNEHNLMFQINQRGWIDRSYLLERLLKVSKNYPSCYFCFRGHEDLEIPFVCKIHNGKYGIERAKLIFPPLEEIELKYDSIYANN